MPLLTWIRQRLSRRRPQDYVPGRHPWSAHVCNYYCQNAGHCEVIGVSNSAMGCAEIQQGLVCYFAAYAHDYVIVDLQPAREVDAAAFDAGVQPQTSVCGTHGRLMSQCGCALSPSQAFWRVWYRARAGAPDATPPQGDARGA